MGIDFRLEAAKQARMEALYDQSGRSNPDHPMHSLFTGLMAEAPSTNALADSRAASNVEVAKQL